MAKTLQEMTDEAYRLFAPYQLRRLMEVCLCNVCMLPEQQREISSVPLRAISPELIREYTNSAHGVPGDLDELKYILPRYLEMLADDDHPSDIGWEVALRRFGDARRGATGFGAALKEKALQAVGRARAGFFNVEEEAFFDNFLLAFLHEEIAAPTGELEAKLVMLAHAGVDLAIVVDLILEDPSGNGPLELAQIAKENSSGLIFHRKLGNPFWDDLQEMMSLVISDMISASTIAALEAAVLAEKDPKSAQTLSDGYAVLEAAAAQT